jgi:hypothetical protein
MCVGAITTTDQVNTILAAGRGDLVDPAIARNDLEAGGGSSRGGVLSVVRRWYYIAGVSAANLANSSGG